MENALAYDDVGVLKKVLNMTVKNLKKDIVKSENDVYNQNIRKKIRFVKWTLDLINSGEFTYQEIMEMIDLKTESRKKDLDNALGKSRKESINDSINILAWIRNMITTTRVMSFTDIS